ncbi:MAG: glycosyltransferase family 4 protein [Flavobacteriales bacterium]|nr:glycosyltransferase family 4 protein [Flavobacteriales bacterium]
MTKVLFIALHRPERSPGQRFRFEQYFDYLTANGFSCELSYLITKEEDKVFYSQGNYWKKARLMMKYIKQRKRDAKRAKDFDIIFIFRDALPTGSIKYEKKFKASGAKLMYDFDDAIFILDVSAGNKALSFLKKPEKVGDIISLCDLVIAGNQYLADYAGKFNQNVTIIPTTIDTEEYQRIDTANSKICIGWSGSVTTIQHFRFAIPFLIKIQEKYGDQVYFKVIGDGSYQHAELNIQGISWTREGEVPELSEFDIGIMPLPDDEWANGKCGLKGLQYMALEIPTLMSPVGVNSDIIQDGENGFLADQVDEWVDKISRLIEDKELRLKMGKAARKTVVDEYSILANQDLYLTHFRNVIGRE